MRYTAGWIVVGMLQIALQAALQLAPHALTGMARARLAAQDSDLETLCDDNRDNDLDGFVDCRDPDCFDAGRCVFAREGVAYIFQTSPARGADGVAEVPRLWANQALTMAVSPGQRLRVFGAFVSDLSTVGGPAGHHNLQGWASSILVDGDLRVVGATTAETAADTVPVGRRRAISFELTELGRLSGSPGPDGVVSAVVLSLSDTASLEYPAGTATVLAIDFEVHDDIEAPRGVLQCHEGLVGGGQPVGNLFVTRGEAFQTLTCLPLVLTPAASRLFRRGDANGDGAVNLTDAVVIFRFLYRGGPEPRCLKSADSDDTGGLGITDVIFLLNSLFRSATLPPAPFSRCGPDPTEDALSCESSPACR